MNRKYCNKCWDAVSAVHGFDAGSRIPDSACGDKRDRREKCAFEQSPNREVVRKCAPKRVSGSPFAG
ncbi:MAG: hypothetical protein NC489_24105 [Ruminococcus flavefaciens]|nr:hypothetical protein [Ruminococcus flavefaciens]